MSKFRSVISKFVGGVEDRIDKFAFDFRKRFGLNDPLQIVTFRSYGTLHRLYVKGRVLEDKGIKTTDQDSLWNNILNVYKRFQSDEVPGAALQVNFQDQVHHIKTDREGYFVLNIETETPIDWEDMWHEVEVNLTDSPVSFVEGLNNIAQVLVPPHDAEYGIISDIDDTIIKTGATNLLAMSRNTFFKNAHSRLPFAGVSEFYKSLQLGRNGKRNNPFFYVSSSPWNLYDLLTDFMDVNDIPPGPLLLRDFGLQNKIAGSDHMGHKFKEIEQILQAYPHLNFILIGDSGQEDPSIYHEVVKKYPDRILAIYIRDVQLARREKIAFDIAKDLSSHKVEMVIVDNTIEAAEHAAKNGLIYTEAIPEIIHDTQMDKGDIPGKENIE